MRKVIVRFTAEQLRDWLGIPASHYGAELAIECDDKLVSLDEAAVKFRGNWLPERFEEGEVGEIQQIDGDEFGEILSNARFT